MGSVRWIEEGGGAGRAGRDPLSWDTEGGAGGPRVESGAAGGPPGLRGATATVVKNERGAGYTSAASGPATAPPPAAPPAGYNYAEEPF